MKMKARFAYKNKYEELFLCELTLGIVAEKKIGAGVLKFNHL